MTNDFIKEITKNVTQSDLEKTWIEFTEGDNSRRNSVILEEFFEGKRMRSNGRGNVKSTLHAIESERKNLNEIFEFIFHYPCIQREDISGTGRTNVVIQNVECYLGDGYLLKGNFISNHYLIPIPSRKLKDQSQSQPSPQAIIHHEFVATLLDTKLDGTRHFYIGNIRDFANRVMKRAFAKNKIEHLQETRQTFGF